MILYINMDEIYAYSDKLSPEEEQKEIELGIAVAYNGDFSFEMGEHRAGMEKVFKWDGEKPVVEYIPINQPQPTQLDRIEAVADYMAMQR